MNRKLIISVIGARPQFIKCKPVSIEIRRYFDEIIIHTGQHYDQNMSNFFFRELEIPTPDYNLEVGSQSHAKQTAQMLAGLEDIYISERPDSIIVYGDTNSTLAGALAGAKLKIPVVHIESGLRSFNKGMPEEINRVLTDHISKILFCPTPTAIKNLKTEGIVTQVFHSGDVMYDALLKYIEIAKTKSTILKDLNVTGKNYLLATIHRAENTDNLKNLQSIISGLNRLNKIVIIPLHPRTRKMIYSKNNFININSNIKIIDPLGYLDFLTLQMNALKILTDSGGIQKEAYFLKIPCITLRNETEWLETVDMGVNILTGSNSDKIVDAANSFNPHFPDSTDFGNGTASTYIANKLKSLL
jgi:UDP-GlcNAc3NAcA epimerase